MGNANESLDDSKRDYLTLLERKAEIFIKFISEERVPLEAMNFYAVRSLDEKIRKFVEKNPNQVRSFNLEPGGFPRSLCELADCLYPDDEYLDWLKSGNQVYDGKSPLEVLSELDPAKLRESVIKMHDGFVHAFSFCTVSYFPSVEQCYLETRVGQADQLDLI